MLTAEDVQKTYRDGTVALKGVSLSCGTGVTGLLGPNGAGKTTLMQILCGLLAPTSGEVIVEGRSAGAGLERHRTSIGYVPQSFGFPHGLSVRGMLMMLGRLRGIETAALKKRVSEILEILNLSDKDSSALSRLSGGMRQRACIAQALIHDPSIIIFDEPTVGLDPEERTNLLRLLVEMGREKTILLSTHIVDDAEAACSHFIVMRKGAVAKSGDRRTLLAGENGTFAEQSVGTEIPSGAVVLNEIVRNGERRIRLFVGPGAGTGKAEPVEPTVADIYALTGKSRRDD